MFINCLCNSYIHVIHLILINQFYIQISFYLSFRPDPGLFIKCSAHFLGLFIKMLAIFDRAFFALFIGFQHSQSCPLCLLCHFPYFESREVRYSRNNIPFMTYNSNMGFIQIRSEFAQIIFCLPLRIQYNFSLYRSQTFLFRAPINHQILNVHLLDVYHTSQWCVLICIWHFLSHKNFYLDLRWV